MNEYKKLQLGSLVKLAVDSRGITNGSIDILSFEYDIDSEIDRIVDYVDNNNFPELRNQVNDIKEQSELLEDKIKDTALEILTLQLTTDELTQKIQQYNNSVGEQYNQLVELTKSILNRLEPQIIFKDKIVTKKEYIETRTIVYRGVKSEQEIRKEEQIIKSNRRIFGDSGWFEYSDDWMVQLSFGKEIAFMKKKLYEDCLQKNIPFYSMYDAKKWHRQYDK